MKKLICPLLILSLTLIFLTVSSAQDADFDPVRAADVNADGTINILDLTTIATHFNTTPPANLTAKPDINGDGIVNILDLTLAASHFGRRSGIPFEVTDVNFDDIVLGSELPIVVEFKNDA